MSYTRPLMQQSEEEEYAYPEDLEELDEDVPLEVCGSLADIADKTEVTGQVCMCIIMQ